MMLHGRFIRPQGISQTQTDGVGAAVGDELVHEYRRGDGTQPSNSKTWPKGHAKATGAATAASTAAEPRSKKTAAVNGFLNLSPREYSFASSACHSPII
jgi:hypothetical protein